MRTALLALLLAACAAPVSAVVVDHLPPGGANAPEPSAAPEPALEVVDLPLAGGAVRIPTGTYEAPGGAPLYRIPGPVVAFQPPGEETFRGYSYLETPLRVVAFTGTHERQGDGWAANLDYTFETGKHYRVQLQSAGDRLLIDETSQLGPQSLWVFDAFFNWYPTAGFVIDQEAVDHNFLYLPCHYDKAEVIVRWLDLTAEEGANDAPAGLAVVTGREAQPVVAGFIARDAASWEHGDRMGIELWQRRQPAGDFAGRHFLGPETKSDGTPNPYTAEMIGTSSYEGHVTIEFALAGGSRKLVFGFYRHQGERQDLPVAFKELARTGE